MLLIRRRAGYTAEQTHWRGALPLPCARVPAQAWGEALEALMAQLPPLPYDDGGPIGERLVDK